MCLLHKDRQIIEKLLLRGKIWKNRFCIQGSNELFIVQCWGKNIAVMRQKYKENRKQTNVVNFALLPGNVRFYVCLFQKQQLMFSMSFGLTMLLVWTIILDLFVVLTAHKCWKKVDRQNSSPSTEMAVGYDCADQGSCKFVSNFFQLKFHYRSIFYFGRSRSLLRVIVTRERSKSFRYDCYFTIR